MAWKHCLVHASLRDEQNQGRPRECATPARARNIVDFKLEITAWIFASIAYSRAARTHERISTVSVIFSKSACALQVPEQMAPLRPLFGHESIGWQWCCTNTSERQDTYQHVFRVAGAGSSFSAFVRFVNDCGYELWTINEQGEPDSPVQLDAIKAHNHLCLPTGCD